MFGQHVFSRVFLTCVWSCSDKCSNTHLTCSGLFLTLGRVIGPTFSCLFLLFLNKCLSTRWIPLAQSLIMCYDHMFPCMLDSVFVGRFDPTAPLPAASFWNEHSSISAICANVLFVFQPSLGSRRKKALGFENILSLWCSSFGICITTCRTSFPCGWVQSSFVRWQRQCFLSTSDLTLRW